MSGYVGDIGASSANASSAAATQNAGTTFNFNSAGARGDVYASETGATSTATATASKNAGQDWLIIGGVVVGVVGLLGLTYYLVRK